MEKLSQHCSPNNVLGHCVVILLHGPDITGCTPSPGHYPRKDASETVTAESLGRREAPGESDCVRTSKRQCSVVVNGA